MNFSRMLRAFVLAAALPGIVLPPAAAQATPVAKTAAAKAKKAKAARQTPVSSKDRPKARFATAAVIDAATGEMLYADKPDQVIYPASTTKVMTAYLTFEALRNKEITLDQ